MIKGCIPKKLSFSKFGIVLIGLLFLQPEVYAAEQVAVVIASIGKVSANARTLARRSALYQGDTVKTEAGSKVSFKFTDGSVVTLKENSAYAIKSYSFNKTKAADTFDAHLLKGGLKTITGTIGKEAQHTQDAIDAGIPASQQVKVSNYKVKAAIATIGVRGTEYTAVIKDSNDNLTIYTIDGTVETSFNDESVITGAGGDGPCLVVDADGNSSISSKDLNAGEDFDTSEDDDDDDSSDDDSSDDSSDDDSGDDAAEEVDSE